MATDTNIGPCECCGGVADACAKCGGEIPLTLHVTLVDHTDCGCLDGITFTIVYDAPNNRWIGTYESEMCVSGRTATSTFILSCTFSGGTDPDDLSFVSSGGSVTPGSAPGCQFGYFPGSLSPGQVVEIASCDPFYLEVSGCWLTYNFSSGAPDYGNCCDNGGGSGATSKVTVIISEVPP